MHHDPAPPNRESTTMIKFALAAALSALAAAGPANAAASSPDTGVLPTPAAGQARVVAIAPGPLGDSDIPLTPVSAGTAAASTDVVAALPEPDGWLLPLAGLAAVGWVVLRRNAH